jgi:prepilin-type processing-associated H-X9-DG protein
MLLVKNPSHQLNMPKVHNNRHNTLFFGTHIQKKKTQACSDGHVTIFLNVTKTASMER